MHSGEASIRDSFRNGTPELDWLPYPNFNQDNLRGTIDETSPEGEPGVGVLDNKNAGGFAALSYASTNSLSDFYLEAWIHAQVTRGEKGPLNGIAFLIDTVSGNFYRLATQFMGAEPTLSLAYVGRETNHFPEYLKRWKGEEIPGGAPQSSGWQKIAIAVYDSKAELYWNGTNLPGGPFPIDRVQSGHIGVYANFVGGLGHAETKVDGLRVWPRAN
ncbi:MAG TPA: hypothetical protein VFS81_19450 [Candidatus Binatia bacterium]|nr:hypothetical protein [Candidatus Binatia bacterium]